jgi:hypothetical protein
MQKVIVAELQSHFHKNLEEPFQSFLEQGWKVVSVYAAAANMNESKAACWVTAVLEMADPAPGR